MTKEENIVEAIKGLNQEKLILTESLVRISHNQAIKVQGRLREIDEQVLTLLSR